MTVKSIREFEKKYLPAKALRDKLDNMSPAEAGRHMAKGVLREAAKTLRKSLCLTRKQTLQRQASNQQQA